MFISALFVGKKQEQNTPTLSLAVWSWTILTALDRSNPFYFESAEERGNGPGQPLRP